MSRQTVTRRNFIKIAGASIVAIPVASGYALFRSSVGEFPTPESAYDIEFEGTIEESGSTITGPILLLINETSDNQFGLYLGEILLAEGLNCFDIADLANLNSSLVEPYDIVLLSETALNMNQIEVLEEYVFNGGSLIAMRPDHRLSRLFGIEAISGTVSEGYIKVESDHSVTDGIIGESLQFHGAADRYRLAGSESVAWVSNESMVQSEFPGITINQFGDGRAAMWSFDLARSVAYMRQGNPAQSDQDLDGLDGVRTVDLFVDWIDLDRITIPQADEQQRLFTNLLVEMSKDERPLPRMWYFPGQTNAMLVATGDSHMNPAPCIDEVLTLIDERSGHMSVYYSPLLASDLERTVQRAKFLATDYLPVMGDLLAEKYTTPTPTMVSNWRARGHEFTLHPYVEDGLEEGWNRYWKEFTGRGYGQVSPTVRTHRVLWSGWTETARVQSTYGIEMNMDYYHVGPSLQKKNGEWVFGHLTGSGLPMRFVDEQGRILNIFQQNTQLADEHLMDMDVPNWGGWANLTSEEAVEVSKTMLNRSIENGGYSATTFQFHVDPYQIGGEAADKARSWLIGTLDHAATLNLPIWSSQEWLQFTKLRFSARFENVEWDSKKGELRFELVIHGDESANFDVLIPLSHSRYQLDQIIVDGAEVDHDERRVGGIPYAAVLTSSLAKNFTISYQ